MVGVELLEKLQALAHSTCWSFRWLTARDWLVVADGAIRRLDLPLAGGSDLQFVSRCVGKMSCPRTMM